MIGSDQCLTCAKTRADGWLLIDGYCAECNREVFEGRREVLRQQAAELAGEDG